MPNQTVKTWRDDVSFKLGQIIEKQENMHSDIKVTNGKVNDHEDRIDDLETIESNRKAVKKYMAGVWAILGGTVVWVLQKISPVAFSIFK